MGFHPFILVLGYLLLAMSINTAPREWALALCPVLGLALTFVGCKSQNNPASAALPPAGSAAYPESAPQSQPASTSPSNEDIFATYPNFQKTPPAEPTKKAPAAPKFKPFVLRDGEALVSHKVQRGETLSKMATMYGTTVSRIKSANGLSSDKIYAGKSYKVPTKQKSPIQVASGPPAPPKPTQTVTAPSPPVSTYKPPTLSPSPSTSSYRPPTISSGGSGGAPSFAPRDIQYNGPSISTNPSMPSGSTSITIPSGGSTGSTYTSPDLGSF